VPQRLVTLRRRRTRIRILIVLVLIAIGIEIGWLVRGGLPELLRGSLSRDVTFLSTHGLYAAVFSQLFAEPMELITSELEEQQTVFWNRVRRDTFFTRPPLPSFAGYTAGDSATAGIFLLGLDGATWKVLRPLLAADMLPNIERLLSQGSYGELQTDEAFSPVSWTTIATGKNVNKTLQFKDRSELWYFRSRAVRAKRFWDILARPGGSNLAIVNYFFTPDKDEYPDAYLYQADPPIQAPEHHFDAIINRSPWGENRPIPLRVVEKLTAETAADVVAMIERETDDYQHMAMSYFQLDYMPRFRSIEVVDESILKTYRSAVQKLVDAYVVVDEMVGRLMERHAEDYIFIVSDHGFHTRPPHVEVTASEAFLNDVGMGPFPSDGIHEMLWHWNGADYRVSRRSEQWGSPLLREVREPHCIVFFTVLAHEYVFEVPPNNPAAGERLYRHLKNVLSRWNTFLFRYFTLTRTDHTLVLSLSPRMISLCRWLAGPTGADVRGPLVIQEKTNLHDPVDSGVLIAYGPNLGRDQVIEDASVFDITPTILHLKGRPVGADMDGKVLAAMIDPRWMAAHPVRTIPTHDDPAFLATRKPERGVLSEQREAQLKALGYLK
jgi:hypothetical protein